MRNFIIVFLMTAVLAGCSGQREKSADAKQKAQTERMVSEANNRIGMPGIVNFTEKRFAKMIYELRDKEMSTYTYFVDMNGRKHFLCESIGYGLPYSVQYVSPQKLVSGVDLGQYSGNVVMPQAEPNGLFMPDTLSATWVLCMKDGEIKPIYSEPALLVSPFKLH